MYGCALNIKTLDTGADPFMARIRVFLAGIRQVLEARLRLLRTPHVFNNVRKS